MSKMKKIFKEKIMSRKLRITFFSILLGLVVGAIVLALAGHNPFEAYKIMFFGIFGKPKYIAWTIVYATPIIITGLSVTFAFRTGLFNIGAEGQFVVGALVAALVGYFVNLPPVLHVIVVLLAAAIAAGIWGGIAGYLKAKFGINEVIATIMLNWIALYMNNYIVMLPAIKRAENESTHKILETASMKILGSWKMTEAGVAWRKSSPFWGSFFKAPVNTGFIVAILLAVLVWYILNKTTLGYELRAVGINKHAAEYGGIDINKSVIKSMVIAGALAGIAGAVHVMGYTENVSALAVSEGYGFDGIAVALIAGNVAIGNIFAGLLYGALKYAGPSIEVIGAPSEMVKIIIGTIVFFIAIPKFIKMIFPTKSRKRGDLDVK